jgi:hypothetical protein
VSGTGGAAIGAVRGRRRAARARLAAWCALSVLAGCQSGLRDTVAAIDDAYAGGRYEGAASIATDAARRFEDDRIDRLLWWLEAGRTEQAAGRIPESMGWYDRAFDEVRPYLDSKAEATVTEALVTTAVNQTMRTYRATPPERVMLCALQGANALCAGDLARARVELNRAADFQQDAAARFAKEINAAQDQANAAWAKEGWASGVAGDALGKVRTAQERPQAPALGVGSFANPFASYLRAAFLLSTSLDPGDRQNARADLRGVQEMVPDLAPAADDIALVDAGGGLPAVTWVFFLTGLAPDYREFRLDIPIPVGNVNYVSGAFPVLRKRGDFVDGLALAGEGGARGVPIADLDVIVEAEFDARLPLIVTQEIISSAGKAAATWASSQAAYQQSGTAGAIVQIMGIVYQAASTAADLRCWSTMPKQVHLLRVPTPADGRLALVRPDGAPLASVEVDAGAPNVVLVTLPSARAQHAAVMRYRGSGAHGPPAPHAAAPEGPAPATQGTNP